MIKVLLTVYFFGSYLWADVLLVEDDVITFSVPEDYRKRPSLHSDILLYLNSNSQPGLLIQLFRKNQWSDWHMRGLKKSQKTFQKFFDTELGGGHGEKLLDVFYDETRHELTLEWVRRDGLKLISKMKLTSFGCIAVHVPFRTAAKRAKALDILNNTIASLRLPAKYNFVPVSMADDLMTNIGGGFFFIVLSLTYLMFSLFKRSQLRQNELSKKLTRLKTTQVPSPIKS